MTSKRPYKVNSTFTVINLGSNKGYKIVTLEEGEKFHLLFSAYKRGNF